MGFREQEMIDQGFDDGLTVEEIFMKIVEYDDVFNRGGYIHAFVEHGDSRFSCGVTGAEFIRWEDLKDMPHTIRISATRPQSFHVNLTGFVNTLGSNNDGWPETVRRWKLAQNKFDFLNLN